MHLTWKRCIIALVLIAAVIIGFNWFERPMDELNARIISRGFTQKKVVAFTFDDGPHPVTTSLLLDTLRKYKVKATFFVVGEKAEEYPELLNMIKHDGHQIGCHTYTHDNLTLLSRHDAENELTYWEHDIDRLIGPQPKYLRPPGGDFNRDTISLVNERNYILSLWSVNPGDWRNPPAKYIAKIVLKRMHPGAVVLMHDDGINTIHALPIIIKTLKMQGYRFVRLDEMVENKK